MATTTNYAWTTPDNSGLVKNGAQDIRTLGSAVDTSLWNVGFGQAGKNKIINGDFRVWQRGTSFTANSAQYTTDRWRISASAYPTTGTWSQQTFTPATAPVAGYEGSFFWRYAITTVGSSTDWYFGQRIEDVRTFAGQTATFSFWAKADTARTIAVGYNQNFGSGGSATVSGSVGTTYSLTTSWQRFSATVSVPSISGKTIGTSSYLEVFFQQNSALANGYTIDIWGVQLEYGSVATPFQTATGTIAGELAACQRYYFKTYNQSTTPGTVTAEGGSDNITGTDAGGNAIQTFRFPVTMRTNPTITTYRQDGTSGSWNYSRSGASGTGSTTVDTFGQNAIRFYLGTGANWVVAQTFGHIVASAEL